MLLFLAFMFFILCLGLCYFNSCTRSNCARLYSVVTCIVKICGPRQIFILTKCTCKWVTNFFIETQVCTMLARGGTYQLVHRRRGGVPIVSETDCASDGSRQKVQATQRSQVNLFRSEHFRRYSTRWAIVCWWNSFMFRHARSVCQCFDILQARNICGIWK